MKRCLLKLLGAFNKVCGSFFCLGKFLASSLYKGQKYALWVAIISGLFAQNLLGRSVAKRMGLVKRLDPVNMEVFRDIFGNIGF